MSIFFNKHHAIRKRALTRLLITVATLSLLPAQACFANVEVLDSHGQAGFFGGQLQGPQVGILSYGQAVAPGSTSIGYQSVSFGASSSAYGESSSSGGSASSAYGFNSSAAGDDSVAIGHGSLAGTLGSPFGGPAGGVAIGLNSNAVNANDVALGANSVTAAPNIGTTARYGGTAAGTASSVASVGMAGAERQVQNVAPGVISANSTDAINGSQLFTVTTGIDNAGTTTAANFGAGATYDPATGAISSPAYMVSGITYNNVGSAIAALNSGSASPKYFQSNSVLAPANAIGVNSVAIGPTSVATGAGSSALGLNAQSFGTNSMAFGSGATSAATNSIAFGTAASAGGLNAIAFGANSAAIGANSVSFGPNAIATGANSVAIGAGSVASDANTVSFGAPGMTRTLSNISAGVALTDAVNVNQLNTMGTSVLNQANGYTNQVGSQVLQQGYAYTNNASNALRGQISDVQRSANQGTAAAVAMLTSIKTPNPGKSVVSVGGGYYGGQAGVALSASHRSRDSRWHSAAAIGVPVTISSGQNIACGGSVGFEF